MQVLLSCNNRILYYPIHSYDYVTLLQHIERLEKRKEVCFVRAERMQATIGKLLSK